MMDNRRVWWRTNTHPKIQDFVCFGQLIKLWESEHVLYPAVDRTLWFEYEPRPDASTLNPKEYVEAVFAAGFKPLEFDANTLITRWDVSTYAKMHTAMLACTLIRFVHEDPNAVKTFWRYIQYMKVDHALLTCQSTAYPPYECHRLLNNGLRHLETLRGWSFKSVFFDKIEARNPDEVKFKSSIYQYIREEMLHVFPYFNVRYTKWPSYFELSDDVYKLFINTDDYSDLKIVSLLYPTQHPIRYEEIGERLF